MITRRHLVTAGCTSCAALALPSPPVAAQVATPVIRKLTRMIVGYPPGGSTDVIARLLIDQMKGYAPTIIIDNRPGTGGRLALETLKVAPPDGSVMALTPATTIAIYPHVYKPIGYDALADFIAVATVASFSSVLSVGPIGRGRDVAGFHRLVPGEPDARDLWDDGRRVGPAFHRHDARQGGGFRVHPRALQER
jgi:tripartite-type tricarboxylate transporter receptor subunit TctC